MLFKNVGYISVLATVITICCALFPELVITILFGKAYIGMAPLLWKYALATSFFSISNIFTYYFLSLDNYYPVIMSLVFGLLQIVLVIYFHDTL